MNRKQLLFIAPALLLSASLVGCGGGGDKPVDPTPTVVTVTGMLIDQVYSPFYVGDTIDSKCFNVIVSTSDGAVFSTKEYTTNPAFPYELKKGDAEAENGKEITFTYKDYSQKFYVDVYQPQFAQYCKFNKTGTNSEVKVSKIDGVTLPKNLLIPGEVDGQYVEGGSKGEIYTVTEVGSFGESDTLKTITFTDGVTTIHSNSFTGCKSLKTITFPESLHTIETNAFIASDETTERLGSVYFEDTETSWTITDSELKKYTWTPRINEYAELNAGILHSFRNCKFTKNID